MKEKYLYCIAYGGLNDVLNQIMHCHAYCQKYRRILAINTYHSCLEMDIGNYFKIDNYPLNNLLKNKFAFCKDLDKDFEEEILVYANHTITGGRAKDFFNTFEIKPIVLNILRKRRCKLPTAYTSVHIRNTDYQSNVEEFINKNKKELNGKNIFLASDNSESIEKFKQEISGRIYHFANIPKFEGNDKGIHKYKVYNKNELNIDSIVDLLLLSLGEKVLFSCDKSWYSKNAVIMNSDECFKMHIIKQMEIKHI